MYSRRRKGGRGSERRRLAPLLAVALPLALFACSNRLPTEPAATSMTQSGAGPAGVTSPAAPRRPSTRVVAHRGSTPFSLLGVWGGDHVGLDISPAGAGVDFDCAAGSIDGPFLIDPSGRFDLLGTWWFTPPVVFEGWQPEKRPARYFGLLRDGTMALTVLRLDDNQYLGSFTLVLNQTPRVFRCL
jgi:hypothetical protein